MKKIILILAIVAVLLGSNFALALEPCPLAFDVLTSPPDTEVTVKIIYKDDSWTGITKNGELVMDLGDKNIPGCIYQNFDLVVLECEDNPVCHKTVSFNSDGYTIIDIREAWLEGIITTTTIEPDKCICEECDECKPCYCDECVCEECKCPEGIDSFLAAFIGLIVGGFGIFIYDGKIKLVKKSLDKLIEAMPKGCGLRIFKAYSGKSDIKHFHRSPKTYHTLDKRHKDKYDHEGEKNLFPDFEGD